MNSFPFIAGAVMAGISVAFGAFGAHALTDVVSPDRLQTWQTAARYLMNHGLALLLIGVLTHQLKLRLKWPTYLLFTGACVFCASLFLLVLLDLSWLGAIAPIGGVLMISGWFTLSAQLFKYFKSRNLE